MRLSRPSLSVQPREGGNSPRGVRRRDRGRGTANIESGLLAIVPQRYKVIGGSDVYETPTGEEFERALPLGIEALLLEGGHIERVENPAKRRRSKGAQAPPPM
jgi:hypothetical protein